LRCGGTSIPLTVPSRVPSARTLPSRGLLSPAARSEPWLRPLKRVLPCSPASSSCSGPSADGTGPIQLRV
jgi:hypothetical protein